MSGIREPSTAGLLVSVIKLLLIPADPQGRPASERGLASGLQSFIADNSVWFLPTHPHAYKRDMHL